ncbi:HEAT repeat domain-containing protein [Myxococcus sp. AB025B]|uniref:HEAT repeat domain-containing protein n=1 Tax=Myxococcus sp. AB025B TaxID=2562794 RepID=UPI00114164A4|nr:HEAT repeat domain-containing protein [Myxococcus sp. AB025B]
MKKTPRKPRHAPQAHRLPPPSAELAELLGRLETGDADARWEASMSLMKVGDAVAAEHVARLLRTADDVRAREVSAWLLCSLGDGKPSIVDALLQSVEDTSESMDVRGQAVEALGSQRTMVPALRERVLGILVELLEHPAAELRFWACFALGAFRYRPALPALRRVAQEDERVNPGWWYVSEEALDAIAQIESREYPDRIPVLQRDRAVP